MNTYRIHAELASAVRSASQLRQELASNQYSLSGRVLRRLRYAYQLSHAQTLTRRLHTMHRTP